MCVSIRSIYRCIRNQESSCAATVMLHWMRSYWSWLIKLWSKHSAMWIARCFGRFIFFLVLQGAIQELKLINAPHVAQVQCEDILPVTITSFPHHPSLFSSLFICHLCYPHPPLFFPLITVNTFIIATTTTTTTTTIAVVVVVVGSRSSQYDSWYQRRLGGRRLGVGGGKLW